MARLGMIGILIVAAIGGYLYLQQSGDITSGGNTPATAIDVTGVRMDLIAIANAERRYFVANGRYGSLGDLQSDGETVRDGRPNFSYSVETSGNGFLAIASYTGSDPNAPGRISVDETLSVQTE